MVNIEKIKSIAKVKGISITHLCATVGQGPYYLNDVKNKLNGKMPDSRLEIIADKLGTTTAYLRDETDDPEIKKPISLSDMGNDPIKIEMCKKILTMSRKELEALDQALDLVLKMRDNK